MKQMSLLTQTFIVELICLGGAAPFLYFPNQVPAGSVWVGLCFLVMGWLWRRWQLGFWRVTTAVDWPLFLLFAVILPISLWAAPEPLRMEYSWPRVYILLWNFCLFWVVVIYSRLDGRLFWVCLHGFIATGVLIALVAPLGMAWLYKFPGLDQMLQVIPAPLLGVFTGAESGFHPNQVAGTLLYVLPLALALATARLWRRWNLQTVWLLLAAAGMLVVLLVTQSRAGLLGFGVGLIFLVFWRWRVGRWALMGGGVLALVLLPWVPANLFDLIGNSPTVGVTGGNSIGFRQEVWGWAVTALYDFPFTGMGLGTFRQIVFLLYPISIDPNYNVGHAHNFFLQVGVDWGIPGLIGVLALYGVALWQLLVVRNTGAHATGIKLGLCAALVAQAIYSQVDAVTMGAKTNVMFWWLLALIFSCISTNKDQILSHR